MRRARVERIGRASWRGTVYGSLGTTRYVTLRGTQQQALWDVCRVLALLGRERRWWQVWR